MQVVNFQKNRVQPLVGRGEARLEKPLLWRLEHNPDVGELARHHVV